MATHQALFQSPAAASGFFVPRQDNELFPSENNLQGLKHQRFLRGNKAATHLSILAGIVATLAVVFLIAVCASRLSVRFKRTSARILADPPPSDTTPSSASCSDDGNPGEEDAGSSGEGGASSAEAPGFYDFPRIDGEENRRKLKRVMRSFYMRRVAHLGLIHTSYTFELLELQCRIDLQEVRTRAGWPDVSATRNAAIMLEDALFRLFEEVMTTVPAPASASESFVVKQGEGPEDAETKVTVKRMSPLF
ncbi:hypothetical protein Emed_004843 [Eimeria media]